MAAGVDPDSAYHRHPTGTQEWSGTDVGCKCQLEALGAHRPFIAWPSIHDTVIAELQSCVYRPPGGRVPDDDTVVFYEPSTFQMCVIGDVDGDCIFT